MAHVLHRTTKQWLKSVNTPDYPSGTWSITPSGWAALEASAVPTMYWKITGTHPNETVSEMSSGEKDTVDNETARLAASKETRNTEVEGKTQDIIDAGFTYDSKVFGLSTQQQADLKSWKAKILDGTDTYPTDWVLLDFTIYAIASRTAFEDLYQTCIDAVNAAWEGELTLKEQIYEAATKTALDAVTDGRSVIAYSGAVTLSPFSAADGEAVINPLTNWDMKIAGTSLLKGSGTVVTITGDLAAEALNTRHLGTAAARFLDAHFASWRGDASGGGDMSIYGRTGRQYLGATNATLSWNASRYDQNWLIAAVDRAGIFQLDAGYANASGFKEGFIALNTHYRRYTVTGITASGTQSQGQVPLTGDINRISVCAVANNVVTLPLAEKGMEIVVENDGAETLQIYPETGDKIDEGAADASVTLAAGSSVKYYAYDSTNWSSVGVGGVGDFLADGSVSMTGALVLKDGTTTTDGGIAFDRTAEDLSVGDGSASRVVHMGDWKTWTPTFTGFSADPTDVVAEYTIIGKLCIARVAMTNGTSNANTFTMTLPAAAHAAGMQHAVICEIWDNSSRRTVSGCCSTQLGSTTLDVWKTANHATWTNSGGKGVEFTICYEIA